MKKLNQYVSAGSYVKNTGKTADADLVYVYIKTKTPQGVNSVEPYTTGVVDKDMKNKLFTAWVQVDKLQQLDASEEVVKVETVTPPGINVDSEGDQLHRADMVRSLSNGSTGSGMKVGVLSDGVDHLSDSVSKGALNSGITVLSNSVGGDEGTAILEVVHALAPGASLYFHDCGTSKISFNQAVDDLAATGCNIIVDDIRWVTEPFFADGVIASHVKEVINSKGIVYVSAAGNSADSHFIGRYYNDGYDYNDFSAGKASDYKYMYVNIKAGETVSLVLQWDDPLDNSTNDYDLYLMNLADGTELSSSTYKQSGSGSSPIEFVKYTNNTGTEIDAQIDVLNYNGAAASKMLNLYIYGNNYIDNVVAADSIFGQAAVPEVITAGAVETTDPTQIAAYSSQGPVQLLDGSTRQKPDICGAAGVTVSGAGGFPTNFRGTSAAAPHIAAIAALLWAKYPSMKNTEVKDLIVKNAVDLGSSGFDSIFGYGRADAYNSYMAMLKTPEAVIKSDKVTFKGFKVQLDGSGSIVGRGTSLTYNWKIVSKPAGSQAQLNNSAAAAPCFTADTIGDYKVSLVVNDTFSNSGEVFADIKVKELSSTSDDMDLTGFTQGTSTGAGIPLIKKPAALADGWMITGDMTNTVKIVNAFTGFVGKQYQLLAAANAVDFNFEKRLIIAALNNLNKVALINMNDDSVSYIDTSSSCNGIVFGRDNLAFALSGKPGDSCVSAIDISGKKVLNTLHIFSEDYELIACDKIKNNIYLGEVGVGASSLDCYSIDEAAGQFARRQYISDCGPYASDLSVSPDGKHVVLCCAAGNNQSYTTFDMDSSDITKKLGEWSTGPNLISAGFTLDSRYIVTSNGNQLKLFDVQSHSCIRTMDVPGANSSCALFSRGGRVIVSQGSGTNNCFTSGIQQSLLKGDFDFSDTVDIVDLAGISKNYNVKSSDIYGWNPEQDLNKDGIIDVYDMVAVSKGM